jgi:hypothetical protein
MKKLVVGGTYKHFKGGIVKVLAEGKHTETEEEMVVYLHLDKPQIWVRPKSMFLDKAVKNGRKVERFKLVKK